MQGVVPERDATGGVRGHPPARARRRSRCFKAHLASSAGRRPRMARGAPRPGARDRRSPRCTPRRTAAGRWPRSRPRPRCHARCSTSGSARCSGRSPIRYLAEWRMHLAARAARDERHHGLRRSSRRVGLRLRGGVQPRVQARARSVAGTLARGAPEPSRGVAGVNAEEWDRRYDTAGYVWHVGPEPVPARPRRRTCPPGRALDVACGEGRNAVWLARRAGRHRGRLLGRRHREGRAARRRHGVTVDWVVADVTTWEPPPARSIS